MKLRNLTALLLAALMLFGALTACTPRDSSEPTTTTDTSDTTDLTDLTDTTDPTDPTDPTDATDGASEVELDVTALSNYAVTEAAPHDETMSAVIAVDADGNAALTNSMLQFPYWMQFFGFMNQYGMYAEYFGLDPYTPLAEQQSMAEDRTWEQYFLEEAARDFMEQYALYRAALDNGHVLTKAEQARLDDIFDPNGSIAVGAKKNGFDSAEAYIQDNFGPGIDLQDYYDYVKVYLTADSYANALAEAYYEAHPDEFAESGIQTVNNVSVRHILITPEQDPATGEATAEAWAAAEKTANEIYAQWLLDPTEDNFAALANEKSDDPGSNTTGGLYEDFDAATMVAEFTAWSFDPTRAYGDSGIVKTDYGYHIMFFVEHTDTKGWLRQVLSQMPSSVFDEIYAAYPITFDFARVRVFDLITMMNSVS